MHGQAVLAPIWWPEPASRHGLAHSTSRRGCGAAYDNLRRERTCHDVEGSCTAAIPAALRDPSSLRASDIVPETFWGLGSCVHVEFVVAIDPTNPRVSAI